MTKKIPLRNCVGTQQRLPKKVVLRIVKNNEGKVFVDFSSKANGRGAYITKSLDVLELAIQRNSLGRALECEIPPEVYEIIRKNIPHE